MPARKRAALALRAALTFSCAVLVHGAVHAAGSGSFVWDSPAHLAMLAGSLALFGVAGRLAGVVAGTAERRRRLALLRAELRGPGWPGAAVTQAVLTALLLAAEGAAPTPDRIVAALLCGLAALAVTSLALRGSSRRVVALLVALTAPRERTCVDAVLAASRRTRLVFTHAAFCLFVPNRPPPAAV